MSDLDVLDVLSPEGAEVLQALRWALKRLGDDPPYYECSAEMIGELAELNSALPELINKWLASLPVEPPDYGDDL